MFEYIDKLRKKKEKTKHRIALSVAFVFAFTIFIFWLTVFLPDFERERVAEKLNRERFKSPVTNFGEIISNSFGGIKKSVGEAREIIKQISTSSAYYKSSSTEMQTYSSDKIPGNRVEKI